MLSRRNVRVKVMQILYAYVMDDTLDYSKLEKRYQRELDQSYALLFYHLYFLTKVAEYVKKDADKRANKHLPSEEDKAFNTKLFDNASLQSIVNNEGFQKHIKERALSGRVDADMVRQIYYDFSKTEEFRAYFLNPDTTEEDDKETLLLLYKAMLSSEAFLEHTEDIFANWLHDESLIQGAIKKIVKALPADDKFYEEFRPSHETTQEFGLQLLYKIFHSERDLLDLIEPALNNWDPSRVAILDMIMLKMGLSEMLYFPSIPTKVTINEFVDISKQYSTPKSKDFINGILDHLMKKLSAEGKIQKQGRGLIE